MIRTTISIIPVDPVQSEYRNKEEQQMVWQRDDKTMIHENDDFAQILATAIKNKNYKGGKEL